MKENGFYETQKIFTEKLIKGLTRVSHLGIFQQHALPKWHKGNKLVYMYNIKNTVLKKLDKRSHAIYSAYVTLIFSKKLPVRENFRKFFKNFIMTKT